MENNTSNHPRDMLAAILKKPITLKNLNAKMNSETKSTVIQQDKQNFSSKETADNDSNVVKKSPLSKQEILIKKIPIKLKNVFISNYNSTNSNKSVYEDNKKEKQKNLIKSISSVLHDDKVQQNDLQKEKVENSIDNNLKAISKDINDGKQSSSIKVSEKKEHLTKQENGTTSVSSNSDTTTKKLDLVVAGSSYISTQESSTYGENTNHLLSTKEKKHISEKKSLTESVSNFNQLIKLKKKVMEDLNVKNHAMSIDVIKKKKTELLQKSNEIKTKHQENLQQLLQKSEPSMRRIYTKEVLDYKASFNTTAPPLFCEKGYNISNMTPVERKINNIKCILTAYKDKIIPMLKTCIENGKQISDILKILLDALIKGDDCVLAKINQNKILQEEVLADLKKLLEDEVSLSKN